MIPAIMECNGFELVAIASRSWDKAQIYANKFGCEALEGYDELLKRDDIQAIYMPLPTGLHKEWIMKALQAKKHIYAEKSIAMNSVDAQAMIQFARVRNCALMEGYMFQYHTQHDKVKSIIANNDLGELRQYRASFAFPPFVDSNNFRYDNEVGGGALRDAAGYVVRSLEYLFPDKFTLKDATVYYNEIGASIYGSVYLIASDGVSALLSFGFDNFYQCNYEIWGSKGKLTAKKAFTPKSDEVTELVLEKQGSVDTIRCIPYNHFVGAMNCFSEACNGNGREILYGEIKRQSELLDHIERLSKF